MQFHSLDGSSSSLVARQTDIMRDIEQTVKHSLNRSLRNSYDATPDMADNLLVKSIFEILLETVKSVYL